MLGQVRQKREKPDAKRYLGKGKVEELQALCQAVDADVVITDDELSPAQVRTLEAALDIKVVDRSEVILDIFAAHANTVQAQLQVELAQLEYEFPRLKRMWTHLDRTAGGTVGGAPGGGIGVRGPGERQLEMDRRLVQRRIQDLKRKLETIDTRRQTMVSGRTRALLLRRPGRLHQRRQEQPDERADRRRRLRGRPPLRDARHPHPPVGPAGRAARCCSSDTVGFVRKFPHHLAASFHATLAEAHEADLLLHVIDASCHESEQEIQAVNVALKEVDCDKKPTLYVLNKVDLVDDLSDLPLLRKLVGDVVCTSAVTGAGLDELRQRVACRLSAAEARVPRAGRGWGRAPDRLRPREGPRAGPGLRGRHGGDARAHGPGAGRRHPQHGRPRGGAARGARRAVRAFVGGLPGRMAGRRPACRMARA